MLLTKTLKTLVAAATALVLGHASAQEPVVWHDLGDNGIKWFQSLSAEFAKTHPGTSVKLLGALASPPANWKTFIAETANDMRELAVKLSAKK